jgi:hypothetical protein
MIGIRRPLEGHVINISVSESDDSSSRGFPDWQVSRVTLQLTAALFGQGATVLFGHDWREDGLMEAIYGFARQVQSPTPASPEIDSSSTSALLINLLPWPDDPYLPHKDLEQLRATLLVESAGLPDGLTAYDQQARKGGNGTILYRYMRARALTYLRHRLNRKSNSRLCMGGRRAGSAGRYPGVVEEALFALRASKPLYMVGMLGGASQQIIAALERRKMPDDFCTPTDVSSLYRDPPVHEQSHLSHDDDLTIDREKVWSEFAKAGLETVSETTHLSAEEITQLFHTNSIDQVIELILVSLSRLNSS